MSDSSESPAVPDRPDAGLVPNPVAPPAERAHMSGGAIAAIAIASVATAAVILVIVLAVNSVGNSTEDQFKQIQYCFDHPRAEECAPQSFSP